MVFGWIVTQVKARVQSMNHLGDFRLIVLAGAVPFLVWGCSQTLTSGGGFDYPKARKADVVDDYHGVKVADPYRWLEDLDSAETKKWVDAQNKITFGYLEQIPAREKIRTRLTELWDYEKFGIPHKKGNRYFYQRNDGLQNQYVLYTVESLGGEPRVLLDPNTFSEDGTVALNAYSVSDDGRLLAYAMSAAGSDWQEWSVRNVATGKDLPDKIQWAKFSGASWTKDGSGFFYSRYDEPKEGSEYQSVNEFNKLYHHRIGEDQSQDTLVYERPDHKDWNFGGRVTDDGRYLIISVGQGTERRNRLYYKDLAVEGAPVVLLIDELEAEYDFIDNDGPVFWIRTDHKAPRGRVIAVDTRKPEKPYWVEVIPQSEETLREANVVDEKFIAIYLKDAYTQVRMFALDGKSIGELALPGIGTAGGFGGKRQDTELFYAFTSFSCPTSVYRYDFKTAQSIVFRKPQVKFNPDLYVSKQVFYHSKDGTRVPMFITHKKGLRLDGSNPTYLYGYGGFNYAMTPWFSVSTLVWMEMGGVFAVANIRGGGEYGKEWHLAGCKLERQNVFDDFIAAGEWLVKNKYTSPRRLAIGGGSNGGLLVAACMIQRPDLFAAVLPAVGVLDMLRFHKFTIGWAWVSDYGSPDDPEEFRALYAYSPLHNLKKGTHYPATMLTTADHDDRVVPAHSFKFAAALQEAQGGRAPTLIRIETKAGHGAGKPTAKRIEEQADEWAFLVDILGM